MGDTTLVLVLLGLFFVLLAFGQYIHTVLLSIGILGVVIMTGFDPLGGFLRQDPFNTVASFTLTTVPLFVLMAQFVMQSGLVKDLYLVIFKISGGTPGFLGLMTVVGGGMLGAVAGSGTATAAALGQVAVPEMRRYGYSRDLASGVAASAGSLSGIMPPSIILIIYGSVAQESIGRIFIGAIIPAVLMTAVFIGCTLVALRYQQRKGRKATKVPARGAEGDDVVIDEGTDSDVSEAAIAEAEALSIARVLLMVAYGGAMVTIIFGGIYSGILTPTEAGAVGAAASLLFALALGRVNLTFIRVSCIEAVRVSAMVLFIVVGAQIFGRFISLSLLPRRFINLLEPVMGRPLVVMIIIIALLFLMFMFIEGAAVIVMAVPVFLPVVLSVGFDALWFGVLIGALATLGLLTPPVGLSVYGLVGITASPAENVFRYTTAFALAGAVIVCGGLMLFPEMALWLPRAMG